MKKKILQKGQLQEQKNKIDCRILWKSGCDVLYREAEIALKAKKIKTSVSVYYIRERFLDLTDWFS